MLNALLFNVPFWLFIFKSILANLKDIVTLFQLPPLATLTTFPGAWALVAGLPMLPQLLLFSTAGIIQIKYPKIGAGGGEGG